MEIQLHAFLTSALDESEYSASLPGFFTPNAQSKKKKKSIERIVLLDFIHRLVSQKLRN
jgi:hypothetical protein